MMLKFVFMWIILFVILLVKFEYKNVVELFIFLIVIVWCKGVVFLKLDNIFLKFLILEVVKVWIGFVEIVFIWIFFLFKFVVIMCVFVFNDVFVKYIML